uniref:EOG090X06H8 n=1 Tax=Daphnia pulex TaxID=6669 RepID=A0A4Y7MUP1_DAPPU|nr:EOG090X06H8 [Daphnia pulex]
MTAFLNGLRNESRDVAVSQLLHYLPLLRPANSDGVRGYIHLLPGLLASFLEDDPNHGPSPSSAQHQSTEIHQLLTYALIHPALSLESKRSLAELIRQLDDEGNQDMALSLLESNHQGGLDMFPPSDPQSPDAFHSQATRQRPHNGVGQWDPWSSPSPAGLGPPTKQPPPSSCTIQRIRRSNSLTPPSNSMVYPQDPWGSNQNDNGRIKPRSLSLSSPSETTNGLSHCPLSPQNSLASSGSGSGSDSIYSDDNHRPSSFHIPGSGMRDVPSWLKGLRLHKYAHLFSLLTYDEMLALTEEQLELQGVTKGARHKIALSILRLRERPTLLAQLEKEVVDTGSLHNALSELKNLLSTPIKPYRGPPVADDQLFIGNLSPSPSPLMTRDDTSGYSSLDGSMDNLAAARGLSTGSPTALETSDLSKPPPASPPSTTIGQSSRSTLTASDMPTVIVSAAPDVDSAEEGSDTSADDGLGDNLSSGNFRSAFGNELELLGGPTHLSLDDLPGQITRLLGKICTQLLVSSCPAEDNVSQFVALMDRCLSHEAFTQRQRRRIASWKEQAHRIWNNLAPSASAGLGNGTAPGSRGSNNSAIVNATNGGGGGVVGSGGVNAAQMRPGPAPTTTSPHNNPHSLQVGSHLPLQHRNSFCVSALSHQSSLYSSTSSSTSSSQGYSSLSCGVAAADPFTFSPPHRMHFDELPSESLPFASQLGIQRARSAPMANGGVINSSLLFSQERDASEMDLNHRLESLCLSMTEHALEGANDI